VHPRLRKPAECQCDRAGAYRIIDPEVKHRGLKYEKTAGRRIILFINIIIGGYFQLRKNRRAEFTGHSAANKQINGSIELTVDEYTIRVSLERDRQINFSARNVMTFLSAFRSRRAALAKRIISCARYCKNARVADRECHFIGAALARDRYAKVSSDLKAKVHLQSRALGEECDRLLSEQVISISICSSNRE